MQSSADIQGYKKHSWPILVLFFSLSISGLLSLQEQNLSLLPTSSKKQIFIHYSWRDAPAIAVEKNITSILESCISSIKGIEEIRSYSGDGFGKIDLLPDQYSNIHRIRFELLSRIRQVYQCFPSGVTFPRLSYVDDKKADNSPMMIYILSASDPPDKIQKMANDIIKRNLSSLDGIKMIRILGGGRPVKTIEYDPQKCEAFNFSAENISDVLQQYFNREELGLVPLNNKNKAHANSIIRLKEPIDQRFNWQKIPLGKTAERIVYLGDIGKTYNTVLERQSIYRINGLDAIHILIYPEDGTNQLKCSKQIREEINKISKVLPSTYHLFLSDDKTDFVEEELKRIFRRTIFTLLILMLFLVLINNKGPYLLIIFLSLIVNIFISFLFYYLFNIEIHLYSLAGITISLGMIIDNSIIMTDHIFFRKNIRIFPAVLASTLTSMASLLLIQLLPDAIKLKLQDFMMVIVINLLVSLFVALFFVPSLALQFGYFDSGKKRRKLFILRKVNRFNIYYQNLIASLVKRKKLAFLLIVLSFGIPTFMLPGRIPEDNPLSGLYNNSIGSDWYARNLMPYTDFLLGGTFRLFYRQVLKRSTDSRLEKTELQLSTRFPETLNIDQVNDIIKDLEKHLKNYRGINKYFSQIKASGEVRINIDFKEDYQNTSYPYMLKNSLISHIVNGPAMNWKVYGLGRGFNQQSGSDKTSQLGIRIYGYNLEKLDILVDHTIKKLISHPRIERAWYENEEGSGFNQVEEREYEVFPRRDMLLINDLSVSNLFRQLREADMQAKNIFQLVEEGKLNNISLNTKNDYHSDIWYMTHKTSNMLNGIAARHFISLGQSQSHPAIRKVNQHFIKDIQFEYLGGIKYGNDFRKNIIKEIAEKLPVGYHIEELDFTFLKKSSMQFYLIPIIILLIFFICSILFESLIQPLAIILSIPISFMGVFVSFYLFELNFDQGGYAALVLLGGLSVNASIYIINDFNNYSNTLAGRSRLSLYLKAFNSKIIPVLLTLASTILGLLPFLSMGKDEAFWFAFAAASCSGLLFTLLVAVVFVLPLVLLRRRDLSA